MRSEFLVLIDCQRDFYHPAGSYGQHGRPLKPIRQVMARISRLTVQTKLPVIGIRSHYAPAQFSDMPELCRPGSFGAEWHPNIKTSLLLTKSVHSGCSALRNSFSSQRPKLYIAGVCTHRCVRSTVEDLLRMNWPVRVVSDGVATCGLRKNKHYYCLETWSQLNLLCTTGDFIKSQDTSPLVQTDQLPNSFDQSNQPNNQEVAL